MEIFDCEDDVKRPRVFWFLFFSCLWMAWIIGKANNAYAEKAAEVATQNAFMRWWNNHDAGAAWVGMFILGLMGLLLVFVVAHVVALVHAAVAPRLQEYQNRRHQLAFENKMQLMDHHNEQQAQLSRAAQSKQELIMRLGSIDQFVRVLGVEADAARRTIALQAAHGELTTLAAKLASGQIHREALDAPDVREHASETSNDLNRLGLSDDRLNRDIIRMFKLNGSVAALMDSSPKT